MRVDVEAEATEKLEFWGMGGEQCESASMCHLAL